MTMTKEFISSLKFNEEGLIPAIVQDAQNGQVLMLAWMNDTSIAMTIESRRTHFWSRSRRKYWIKGESSGHIQTVKKVSFDCDGDVLLIEVEQTGAACHEGYRSCFYRSYVDGDVLVNQERLADPEAIYKK